MLSHTVVVSQHWICHLPQHLLFLMGDLSAEEVCALDRPLLDALQRVYGQGSHQEGLWSVLTQPLHAHINADLIVSLRQHNCVVYVYRFVYKQWFIVLFVNVLTYGWMFDYAGECASTSSQLLSICVRRPMMSLSWHDRQTDTCWKSKCISDSSQVHVHVQGLMAL